MAEPEDLTPEARGRTAVLVIFGGIVLAIAVSFSLASWLRKQTREQLGPPPAASSAAP